MRLNTRFPRTRVVAIACLLSPVLWAASAPADVKPQAGTTPTKPAGGATATGSRQAATKAVNEAVAKLLKEYQAAAAEKGSLRETSDYFAADKPADVTDEAIVAALTSNLSSDRGADCYVKWQLLSGLGAKVDDALLPRLALAYRGAALPLPRPGLAAGDKRDLDNFIRGVKGTDADTITAINEKLKSAVANWEKRNAPIVGYRDALYKKLPAGPEALAAALDDAHKRAEAGITAPFAKEVFKDLRAWESSSPPPNQARVMSEVVLKIINEMGGMPNTPNTTPTPAAGRPGMTGTSRVPPGSNYPMNAPATFPPKAYERVEFDGKTNHLAWHGEAPEFIEKDALVKLYEDLRDDAAKGGGGGKMKG